MRGKAYSRFSAILARRLNKAFYLYLAAFFTFFAAVDTSILHFTSGMRQAAFDTMVRYRILTPPADNNIVIVDIDEKSLAAMSGDYGRWPWPRQVLGEFLEKIEAQKPQAVVFDILFSDADIYNPDSDAYFDRAIKNSNNTFFTMMRLDAASDSLSRITPAMIPGVKAVAGEADARATVAVVLPHFQAALAGGRLGLNNIYPDPDGVSRRYPVFDNAHGWRIPSLPARIGEVEGWEIPDNPSILLNWRGGAFAYRHVSFSDVFTDMGREKKSRPPDEFSGKIVIVGSTAASLFDLKASPVDRLHPGVEILATAIDNLKHKDYLRVPDSRVADFLLALLMVWSTALVFYLESWRGKIDRFFGASQFILLGISYASINFSDIYINLTGPVSIGIAYFSIARFYSSMTQKSLGGTLVHAKPGIDLHAILFLVSFESANGLSAAKRDKIRRTLEKTGREKKSAAFLGGEQKGIWIFYSDILAISWAIPVTEENIEERIKADVDAERQAIESLPGKYGGADFAGIHVQQGLIKGGENAARQWRMLLSEGISQMGKNHET